MLCEGGVETPYLIIPHWKSQMILPWVLLFLGEWGEALHTLTTAIAMAEKNGDARRVQTFRVYQAGIHPLSCRPPPPTARPPRPVVLGPRAVPGRHPTPRWETLQPVAMGYHLTTA
jgi:hypothetical protein